LRFLSFGQSGLKLRVGLRGGPGGRAAQRAGAHHHALAVAGEHEHVVGVAGGDLAAGVEVVEVDRAALCEVFHLAFADLLSRRRGDRLDRTVERAACAFDRGQLPQPVGVFLGGQVERHVGRMQVRSVGGAVGQPCHAAPTVPRNAAPKLLTSHLPVYAVPPSK